MNGKDNYRALVHSPADSATAFVQYAEKRAAGGGITWGIPSIDKYITPMQGGDVVALCARPGHGKSSVGAYLTRNSAKNIVKRGDKNKCAVYVMWDQTVEEIDALFEIDASQFSASDVAWGRADMIKVKAASLKRVSLPVWIIGKSMARRGTMPRMTVEAVYRAIETMEQDFGVKPEIICLDYIQIIPVERSADRIQQVNEAIIRGKELAIDTDCPIIANTQAGRQVDKYDAKIPLEGDAQWSSGIEQTIDKMFGLWRPWKTEPHEGNGSKFDINGREWKNSPNMLIIKNTKQRGEDVAPHPFVCHLAPQFVQLAEMEGDADGR